MMSEPDSFASVWGPESWANIRSLFARCTRLRRRPARRCSSMAARCSDMSVNGRSWRGTTISISSFSTRSACPICALNS